MQKYLLLIFVLAGQFLFAQDYQNICTPGTTFYRSPGNWFMAFRCDSMIPAGNNDTIFFSYRTIRDTVEYYCADTTNGSALGLKIIKNHAGWFYFFNRSGDTVKINSQASLNQSWKFCMLPGDGYLEAKVTSITPDSVLGLIDQVKVITFQAKDAANNNIPHDLNQKSIKLSQHYGLSKMLDVYFIPNDTDFLVLAGKIIPALGLQDLTWQDIYNFEIGDIFHYSASSYIAGWKTINKVLSKTTFGNDSIVYTMEHCVKTLEANYPYYETIHDTITVSYNFTPNPGNLWLSRQPAEFIRQSSYPGADIYAFAMNPSQNRKYKYASWGGFIFTTNSCWAHSDGWNYPISSGIYTDGLGKVQTYWRQFTGTAWLQMEEDLVYYKKGPETWGTPVSTDCFTLVQISPVSGNNEISVRVTPNPVETQAEIQVSNFAGNDNFSFLLQDFLGRIVMRNSLIPNPFILYREGLGAGLYFLSVYNKDGILQVRAKIIFN